MWKTQAGRGFPRGALLASYQPRQPSVARLELCFAMFVPVGLALGALSGIGSLLESAASGVSKSVSNEFSSLTKSAGAQSASQPAAAPTSKFDFGTLSALLSAQGQDGAGAGSQASALFSKLDANGDGQISKSEFESALGNAGVDTSSADALFSKLDANGDGSISQNELTPPQGAYSHRSGHHHGGGAGGAGGASSLMDATNADGSQTQTTTNPDGSTTTTITYSDGSTVSSTTPAAQGGASGGTPSKNANLIEKLIQMQSALINTQASATAAIA